MHQTCKELAYKGVDVFVSTTNANGNKKLQLKTNCFIKFGERYYVKYYDDTIIGRFSWRFIVSVWHDIKECDLVRIEDIFSTYIPPSLLYAKLFRKPIFISPRGVLSKWSLTSNKAILKKLWLTLLIKPFLRHSWWHATSEQEKIEILNYYAKAKVFVIPNGIDDSHTCKQKLLPRSDYIKKFIKIDKDVSLIVVSMGRLHRKKGFDVLIDAFAGLIKDFDGAVLLIAGADDGELTALKKQITLLSLNDKVYFVGELKGHDKFEFLSGGDMFVLPSHSENFGNVYLEAMAAGLPIVASKETPWSDVEKIGCGKWVENAVLDTEKAMREIIAGNRKEMGELAKEYVKKYLWTNIAKQFYDAFNKVERCKKKYH